MKQVSFVDSKKLFRKNCRYIKSLQAIFCFTLLLLTV